MIVYLFTRNIPCPIFFVLYNKVHECWIKIRTIKHFQRDFSAVLSTRMNRTSSRDMSSFPTISLILVYRFLSINSFIFLMSKVTHNEVRLQRSLAFYQSRSGMFNDSTESTDLRTFVMISHRKFDFRFFV